MTKVAVDVQLADGVAELCGEYQMFGHGHMPPSHVVTL